MKPGSRLAADIGGTFTDVAFFDPDSGALTLGKTLSTPRQMVDGIALGVEKAGTRFGDAEVFLHGSTVAINTLLERKGGQDRAADHRGLPRRLRDRQPGVARWRSI